MARFIQNSIFQMKTMIFFNFHPSDPAAAPDPDPGPDPDPSPDPDSGQDPCPDSGPDPDPAADVKTHVVKCYV